MPVETGGLSLQNTGPCLSAVENKKGTWYNLYKKDLTEGTRGGTQEYFPAPALSLICTWLRAVS